MMIVLKRSTLVFASIMVSGLGAHAAPTDTLARCQKAAAMYKELYNKVDAAALAKIYTDDAVVSNSNWTATGRDAIQKGFAAEMAMGAKFTAIACEYSKSDGIANGSWSGTVKGPGGKETTMSGHWLNYGPWAKPDDPNDLQFQLQRSFITMQLPPPAK